MTKLKSFKQYTRDVTRDDEEGTDALTNKYKRETPGQDEGHSVASFSVDKPELAPTAKEISLSPSSESCWQGYKQIGMKMKGGKSVPNCVKESQPNKFTSDTVLIYRKNDMGQTKEMRIGKDKVNEYLARGWIRK